MNASRLYSLDLLRGLAAFGIVGCHLALSPLTPGSDFLLSFCDANVALFALMSGFFMKAPEDGKALWSSIKSRCRRLLPVYCVWILGYALLGLIFDLVVQHEINPKLTTATHWMKVFFLGDSATHLWFLACLFYAQLVFLPILKVCRRLPNWIWSVVGVGLVVCSTLDTSFFCRYQLRLLAFLVLGYGLKGYLLSIEKKLPLLVSLLIAALLFHWLLRGIIHPFYRDLLLSTVLLAFFAALPIQGSVCCSVSKLLGGTSLCVFLVHPAVTALFGVGIHRCFAPPYGCSPILCDWILAWACALVFACIAVKTPRIRKVVQ